MNKIIDSRIRIPLELRPNEKQKDLDLFHYRYDEVLNLSENNQKSIMDLKSEMKAANIAHGIIHAEYEFGDPADSLNEAVGKMIKDDPIHFSGFGTISMENLQPLKALKQLEKVKELGLLGVNIQPSFFGISIDDKKLYPVYAKAKELDLIVAIHTGINYSTRHPIKHEHPILLDQVLCDFPGLTAIACHASWPWIPEIVAVARKHPNLFLDFGGLAPKYIKTPGSGWEMMYHFMNSLLSEQLLFATDWPVFSMERAVSEWEQLKLKPEVLDKLLWGNAERLFNLVVN